MAILVSKAAGSAFNVASKCIRTAAKNTNISQNYSFISSSQYSSYLGGASNKLNYNKCNVYGVHRSLSTTPACYDDSKVYFTKKHEWVSVVGNLGTIGITDYAQQALGKKMGNIAVEGGLLSVVPLVLFIRLNL